jgi:hypothetical protein
MRCVVCKENIKLFQLFYEISKIQNTDKDTFYYKEYAHRSCVKGKKNRKNKDNKDNNNTSNVVYT